MQKAARLFIFFTFTSMLILNFQPLSIIRPSEASSNDVFIKLQFSPNNVEPGNTEYSIGYLSIVDSAGFPALAPHDLEIKLTSSNSDIATVPSNVIILKKHDYAKFDVKTGNSNGQTKISATFNDQTVSQDFIVGPIKGNMPKDTSLRINIPTTVMNVNSQMVFSAFLQSNNTVLRAPDDIRVSLDYDKSLTTLDHDILVIKKGEYYASGIINTFGKVGNAFIKASTHYPPLINSTSINIKSSEPASLNVTIFPSSIGYVENHFDVFVNLADSSGVPTIASQDIKLNFFSNYTLLDDKIQKEIKQTYKGDMIRKGEYGFHKQFEFTFVGPSNYVIGASAQDLGVSNSTLSVTQPLSLDSPKALTPAVKIYTIKKMPTNATSIVGYQTTAVAGNLDKNEPFLKKGFKYPAEAGANYSPKINNMQVISDNNKIVSILNPGNLLSGFSYGIATISSGQNAGSANIVVALKGIGAAKNSTTVTNNKAVVATNIFSPVGNKIAFDRDGHAMLFLVLLDSSNRPETSNNLVQYVVKPTSDVIHITPGNTFLPMIISRNQFAADQNTTTISMEPVGVDANPSLTTSSQFALVQTSSTLRVTTALPSITGITGENPIGTVQLVDQYGNPDPAQDDISVNLASDSPTIQVPPSITIPKGTSFAKFPIMTGAMKDEVGKITAFANGFKNSQTILKVKPVFPKLIIRTDNPQIDLNTQAGINLSVKDEFGDPVSNADILITPPANSTITPDTINTDDGGNATFFITTSKGPHVSLGIDVKKEGYSQGHNTIMLYVVGPAAAPVAAPTTFLGLPSWALYAIIGGTVGGIGIFVFVFFRKPKQTTEEETEI